MFMWSFLVPIFIFYLLELVVFTHKVPFFSFIAFRSSLQVREVDISS